MNHATVTTGWITASWIVLAVALAIPLASRAQSSEGQPATPGIAERCRALMTTTPEDLPDTPSITILTPEHEATTYGNLVVVQVEPTNFTFGEGRHWHVWVNGALQGMVYQPTTVLNLPPGTYEICALLGDAEHQDLGIPDGVLVTVADAGAGTPTAAPPPGALTPQTEPENSLLRVVLILVLGAFAAGGGWWVGRRLPKKR